MSENKKKLIRNIIVAVVVIVLLAAAILAVVLFKKDAFGLNYFERNSVVATVGDQNVTYGEYVLTVMNYYNNIATYNMYAMYYGYGTYYDVATEAGMADLKQDMLDQLIYQRVYIALSEELGLTLTDEEEKECVQAGKDAFVALEEECRQQAEEAGAADVKAYAKTLMTDYFVNTGSSKNKYIQANAYTARASKFSQKLSLYYGDERGVTEAELPDVYAEYAKTYYEDAYYSGAYAEYIGYMKEGQVNFPYLYVPDSFLFARVITAADKVAAKEIADKLDAGADFEELLQSELNTDEFIKTHEHEYAIGEQDSVFPAEVYTALAALDVGAYQQVDAETTSTDAETGEESTQTAHYFVMRADGQTGTVPYEQVKEQIDESLYTYAETVYVSEKVDAWKNANTVVDTQKVTAFDPAA